MKLDTFEERQAYIEACERRMREQAQHAAESQRRFDAVQVAIQVFCLELDLFYATQFAPLVYRGLFDPNFCKPSTGEQQS